MKRRNFLKFLGLGVPAVIVGERMGFFKRFAERFKKPTRQRLNIDLARVDMINMETWGRVPWKEVDLYQCFADPDSVHAIKYALGSYKDFRRDG